MRPGSRHAPPAQAERTMNENGKGEGARSSGKIGAPAAPHQERAEGHKLLLPPAPHKNLSNRRKRWWGGCFKGLRRLDRF